MAKDSQIDKKEVRAAKSKGDTPLARESAKNNSKNTKKQSMDRSLLGK